MSDDDAIAAGTEERDWERARLSGASCTAFAERAVDDEARWLRLCLRSCRVSSPSLTDRFAARCACVFSDDPSALLRVRLWTDAAAGRSCVSVTFWSASLSAPSESWDASRPMALMLIRPHSLVATTGTGSLRRTAAAEGTAVAGAIRLAVSPSALFESQRPFASASTPCSPSAVDSGRTGQKGDGGGVDVDRGAAEGS